MINEAQILAAVGGGTDEKGKYFRDEKSKKVYESSIQIWWTIFGVIAGGVGLVTLIGSHNLILTVTMACIGLVPAKFIADAVGEYITGKPEVYQQGIIKEKVERARWEDTIKAMYIDNDPRPAPRSDPNHPL